MSGHYQLPDAVRDHANGIGIRVDPRIELLAIVQSLSAYATQFPFLLNRGDLPYKAEVHARFGAYADHGAIAWFDGISLQPAMYNFGAPPTSMLYLDQELRLRADTVPDEATLHRAGGTVEFERFAGLLSDFATRSAFNEFYTSYAATYRAMIEGVKATLGGTAQGMSFVARLEAFYGVRHQSYSLILAPLYGTVGFGPLVRTRDGGTHVYSILGPRGQQGDLAVFGDRAYFTYMQQHEFSHSFVNPLTEKHADLVKQAQALFARMPPAATQKVCGDWEECVNEQIIRAITTFFAFEESDEAGQAALAAEQARGLPFVETLLDGIRDYVASRDRYPTLDAYYPRLLARLGDA